jgi:HRAS-like suppressor 3
MSHHDHQADANDVTFDADLSKGVHLVTKRPGYMHHGIYIGNRKVIHYAGLSRGLCRGLVEMVSIEHFASGFGFEVVPHPCVQYSGLEVVRRAVSRLGERRYRLLTNNCEHFCLWCLFGQGRSKQVEACLRNPARAVGVFMTLIVCMLARDRILASSSISIAAQVPTPSTYAC